MKRPFVWDRPSHGQSIVEFALVSLVLLMLIFGTIDLGRGVLLRSMLTNATRESVRYGIANYDKRQADPNGDYKLGIINAAKNTSPSLNLEESNFKTIGCTTLWTASEPTGLTALANCRNTVIPGAEVGGRLTVCIEYTFDLTAPRLIGFNSIPMRECAQAALR